MTEYLIRRFIKNADDVHLESVRLAYGKLSSITGIVCNILLFIIKFVIGMISGAIAVTGDAFNNLSDAAACLVTLAGYKLSAKPADREHPFGHGRMEYIFSQGIAFMIFLVGYNLLKSSIERIITPREAVFHPVVFAILLLTIAVKLWMSRFNKTLGTRINSVAMLATAEDSRNDVLATGIAALSMLLSAFVGSFPFDGIAGVLVALFIFYSGYGIASDIISRILGSPAEKELCDRITERIVRHPEVLGVHDVVIHDYGPGMKIGSAHIELDQRMPFADAHEVTDTAEQEILAETGVRMSLHMDPVDLRDPRRDYYEQQILAALRQVNENISIHDLRVKEENGIDSVSFEVLLPFTAKIDTDILQAKVDEALAGSPHPAEAKVTFEHGYTEEDEA